MNREKMRPLSIKPSKTKPTKAGRRVWVILIVALILIAVGYFMWAKPEPTPVLPIDEPSVAAEQTEPVSIAKNSINNELDESTGIDNDADTAIPSPTAILNAPIPANDGLAKEEIDRLEDERQRLAEQEQRAAEQLEMNKQLTDMKAEQIALLEQQIAQLEANTTATAETP